MLTRCPSPLRSDLDISKETGLSYGVSSVSEPSGRWWLSNASRVGHTPTRQMKPFHLVELLSLPQSTSELELISVIPDDPPG